MAPRQFPPDITSVEAIQAFVRERVLQLVTDKEKLFKIELAIEEVVTNIVTHGFADVKDGVIEVRLDESGGDTVLEILDNGPPFNPLAQEAPDVAAGIDDRQIGGLGIFLVRQIVKKINYERRDNKNMLRLWLDL